MARPPLIAPAGQPGPEAVRRARWYVRHCREEGLTPAQAIEALGGAVDWPTVEALATAVFQAFARARRTKT